jgi:hypothetical protein
MATVSTAAAPLLAGASGAAAATAHTADPRKPVDATLNINGRDHQLAVYHATGTRIRELPIRIEKLLTA